MTAKRYFKKELKQNVVFVILFTVRQVLCFIHFWSDLGMIRLPNESCKIGPHQVIALLILCDWSMDEDVEHRCFPKGFDVWFALLKNVNPVGSGTHSSHGGCGFARATPSWVSVSTGPQMRVAFGGVNLSVTSVTKKRERVQQHRHHLFHGKVLDSTGMTWLFTTLEEENHILNKYPCLWIHGV